MKAIRVQEYGSPAGLQLEEVTDPVAGKGEVLIDVEGAAVNPIDWKILSGSKREVIPLALPYTPGVEVAGTVAAIGPDVTGFAIGDAVFGFIGIAGGYATKAVVPAERLALVPRSLSNVQASGVAAAALTAWQALHEHAGIKPGQTVLIHGAAGGVGSMAVQLARHAGATVIATASTSKHAYLEELGAHQLIDYRLQPFEKVVADVDVVLDLIGGETQARSWQVLKPGGVLVSPVSAPNPELARVHAVQAKHFATRPDGLQLSAIAELFNAGHLQVEVETFALSQAQHAVEKSMAGHARGKIVLDTRR
ncbi:NADP-dependent oxidoreductase [Pseudomonas sp. PDNC002]|uniref:NADP-dependent oxidoreductase n=1 Tax=Pseudomonas sp. PDNC002 TaxID=2811422 RepID=UPI0019625760|nr:NADP-dependent oxidoreductase [Pseudomonas sp. PDNC002]QRY77755.1 NADP-dependent oxidoreductase [Pseudomonas sp. PDNC002]